MPGWQSGSRSFNYKVLVADHRRFGKRTPARDHPARATAIQRTQGGPVVHAARSAGQQPGLGPNFTPPFPSYPSGHAGFGGALFQVLRRFYGRDDIPFMFVSDEFNGVTVDNQGHLWPADPRKLRSFSEAEEENGQSRIYLGIHFAFDKNDGIAQGRRIADYVVAARLQEAVSRRFRRFKVQVQGSAVQGSRFRVP